MKPSPPIQWAIIGGGPVGVHVAVALLAHGRVNPARLRIIDPQPALLHRWTHCTRSTGMQYLRSPAVHHLGLAPFELLQRAGRKKRQRKGRGLFRPPFNRPALSFFNAHAADVVDRFHLRARHLHDRATHLHPGPTSVRLQLASGTTLHAQHVVLTAGNSDHPHWPEVAQRLRDQGGRTMHVFGPSALEPSGLPERVAVLGGGISAAQVATRLADAGKSVTVIARHPPRVHQFDSDPGWIGMKHMRAFWATSDLAHRRALIQSARHPGTMPSDVLRSLQRARARGTLTWQVGALASGTVGTNGSLSLVLARAADPLEVGALVVATGFSPRRPGGALVDRLVSEHHLPVAGCGFPVVDRFLRWHPRIFVTGPLAELELGPTARNLVGGRRAAERIVGAVLPGASSSSSAMASTAPTPTRQH